LKKATPVLKTSRRGRPIKPSARALAAQELSEDDGLDLEHEQEQVVGAEQDEIAVVLEPQTAAHAPARKRTTALQMSQANAGAEDHVVTKSVMPNPKSKAKEDVVQLIQYYNPSKLLMCILAE
jgi:hypothetical protein